MTISSCRHWTISSCPVSHEVRRALMKPPFSPTASKRAKHSINKIFLPVDLLTWVDSSPLYCSPQWDPLQWSSEQAESAKRWHTEMVSFLNPALIMIWHSARSTSPTSHLGNQVIHYYLACVVHTHCSREDSFQRGTGPSARWMVAVRAARAGNGLSTGLRI